MAVFLKDWGACKSKHLCIAKEFFNVLMGITELTAMAFIKDKHHFLVFEVIDVFLIAVITDGSIQLLDGGHNQLAMPLIELLHQSMGAVDTSPHLHIV